MVWSATNSRWEAGTVASGGSTTVTKKGQILETLTGICDGRSVEVESGNYTLTNVTSTLQVGTSWVDLTGSNINYKPPTGTKQISYKFNYYARKDEGSYLLSHIKVFVDNVECTVFNHSEGNVAGLVGFSFTVKAIFEIG